MIDSNSKNLMKYRSLKLVAKGALQRIAVEPGCERLHRPPINCLWESSLECIQGRLQCQGYRRREPRCFFA